MNIDDLLQDINGGGMITFRPARPNRHSITAGLLRTTPTEHPAITMDSADFVIVTPTQRADFKITAHPTWCFPIGSDKYPAEKWYIASRHLERGTIWAGGIHTGIDYNVEVPPRGDVDRGQPVYAITNGTIYATGYSRTCLASIVIEVQHEGKPLWVRYWHLDNDTLFKSWRPGLPIKAGQKLAHIGNYLKGGDHLHFDMCKEAFHPCVWWTRTSGTTNEEKLERWVDPVSVLKAHLDPASVEASLRIK